MRSNENQTRFLSSFFWYWPIHLPFISLNLVFSKDRFFRTRFKVPKPTWTKAVSILSAPTKWPLSGYLTARSHHFSLALCTVSKRLSDESSLIALSVGNNSEWPNRHFVTLLSVRVTFVMGSHWRKGSKVDFFSHFWDLGTVRKYKQCS